MSNYIPNTEDVKKNMLAEIGYSSIEELFVDIPDRVRLERKLNIKGPMAEMDLMRYMKGLASSNKHGGEYTCFLGAGAYDHYIPSALGHIISRTEFYTSYTPYQPEISQGTLQAIFEYQTMICELTGMDTANASMYDGATAVAEAILMACQATRREKVLVAGSLNPEYKQVSYTYARPQGVSVTELGYKDGSVDLNTLEQSIDNETAAVVIQTPNFFGVIEDLESIAGIAHQNKALLIVSVDPISLALLKPPGELGADIVVGEGQALGNPLNFGGPYVGFFATTKKLMRRMPGRIVGETTDNVGNRGFVLTLQTREQHIRREKATSNICTNQALNALAVTVYLSLMGREGLGEVAEQSLQKAHYLHDKLIDTGLFTPVFKAPFFKEFALKTTISIEKLNSRLLEKGIIGGYPLEKAYPDLKGGWLLAVTEKRTRQEMDALVETIGGIANE
ncbi:MAG: aminomethyl-transferring glycine dehydrogenase subunit GcvPA [Clostridiales bacterium]|nr:aminomethyl-transferring glycine dehydrogenase subunit GcvPA [Clostridiales bacterium]